MKKRKNTWFETVFLPSLFDYAGIGQSKRISEKQFDCFIRQNGVTEKQNLSMSYYGNFYVASTTHSYFWNGRNVKVISSKTGYYINFGETEEESAMRLKDVEKKRYEKDRESASKLKIRKPDIFSKLLEEAAEDLYLCIKLLDASAASDDDSAFLLTMEDLEITEKEYYRFYFA